MDERGGDDDDDDGNFTFSSSAVAPFRGNDGTKREAPSC